MTQSLADQLPAAQVIEAAIVAFSDQLRIEDPEEVAARVSALTDGTLDEATADKLIARAGNDAEEDVVRVLRLLLASPQDGTSGDAVRAALDKAGAKQLAITPELMYMGAALIAVLLVLKPPKTGEHHSIRIDESPDGRKKITIDKKITYLNPKSALAALMQQVFGAGGS
jgi:hypothetical protein